MPPPRLHPKDGHPRHPWLEAMPPHAPGRRCARRPAPPPGDRLLLRPVHVGRSPGRPRDRRAGAHRPRRDHARRLHQRPRRQHRRARHVGQEHALRRCGRRADDRGRTGRRSRTASAGRPSAWSTWRRPSWRPSARTRTAGPRACRDARCSRSRTRPYDPTRTVFSEYHAFASPSAAFMLRNGRYKYNYYVGYEPELFDLAGRSRRGAQPGGRPELTRPSSPGSRRSCAPCSIPRPPTPAPRPTRRR